MDISDHAAAAVVDVTEDEESAVHKVFSSAELISILVENLQSIRDRVRLSKTCRSLLPLVYNDPMSWRKFVLNGFPDITRITCKPYLQAVESLSHKSDNNNRFQIYSRVRLFNRLVELELPGQRLQRDTFERLGPTLLRLDVSSTMLDCGQTFMPLEICFMTNYRFARELFTPLSNLKVLVARWTADERENEGGGIPNSRVLGILRDCCPLLEELDIGWESEFKERTTGPSAEVEFAQPFLVRIDTHNEDDVWHNGLRHLKHLSLAGFVAFNPANLACMMLSQPPIETLNLCGCQALGAHNNEWQLTLVQSFAIPSLSANLKRLNVRGTGFNDHCAGALAHNGARLTHLNASCTSISCRGLKELSDNAPAGTLTVLDLCYCKACTEDVSGVTAVIRRHSPGMRMLGLGGFNTMTLPQLREILSGNEGTMDHLGIGGCTSLDGAETLHALTTICPNLTALNAHKMAHATRASLVYLIANMKKLRLIDVHGTEWDEPLVRKDILTTTAADDFPTGIGEAAGKRWYAMGLTTDIPFHDYGVIRVEGPATVLSVGE